MLTAEQFKFHLARYAKVKETDAAAFMDAVTKILLEKVQAGEEVEIQGLGTFVVIDSQQGRRLGFQVDEKMRKQVNAPFACFEPMVLAAEMKKPEQEQTESNATEEESVVSEETLAEPQETPDVVTQDAEEPVADADSPSEPVAVLEPEPVVASEPEPVVASEPEATPVPEPEVTPAPEPVAAPAPEKKAIPARKRYEEPSLVDQIKELYLKIKEKQIKPWVWISIAGGIVVLIILLVCLCLSSGKKQNSEPVKVEAVEASTDTIETAAKEEGKEVVSEDTSSAPASVETPEPVKAAPEPAKVDNVKKTASVPTAKGKKPSDEMLLMENGSPKMASLGDGGRLTLVALRNYGDKAFWAYIYDVNAYQLGNPNNVPIGLPLYLPSPSYYQIDASDPASIKRAQNRAMQILREWE